MNDTALNGLELFNRLYDTKPHMYYEFSNNKVSAKFYYSYYSDDKVVNKYLTKGLWEKIGFNTNSVIELKTKYERSYRFEPNEENKKQINLEKDNIHELFRKHLDNNKIETIKLFDKRIKQVETQSKIKEKGDREKSNKLQQMGDILIELGYQVSKVFSGSLYYGDCYVKNRKVADKYHKYIENDSKNIKFATIEVKINKQDYKVGFKIETRGQIGCDFEELEEVYNKLKAEKKILEDNFKKI